MTDKPVTDETAHPPVASGSIFNLPNNLTIARIVMIPLFVAIAYWPPAMGIGQSAISDNAIANIGMYQFSDSLLRHFLLTAVFVLAAITDWLDGYFARKLNMTSAFGRFLDPVADKLMVAAALIILVQWHPDIVMAISAIVIISREIAVSALREWMAEQTRAQALQTKISQTDKEIDNMVYQLYGLTNDEIKIIEDSWLVSK